MSDTKTMLGFLAIILVIVGLIPIIGPIQVIVTLAIILAAALILALVYVVGSALIEKYHAEKERSMKRIIKIAQGDEHE